MSVAEPARGLMSIGEVLAVLRADHPDISISKIRYLEAEGLVDPERTPSGYRKFSPRDLERLQYVLRLQRDHFLPLKVIRQKLDDLDAGIAPDEAEDRIQVPRVVLADDGYPSAESMVAPRSELRLSRAELLRAAEVSEEMLDAMEEHGLVTRRSSTSPYDGSALVVARCVAELAAFGLEPRHLRAFRTAADREIGLFEQVVSPLQRRRDPGRADETVRHLAALSVRLHTTLVKQGLRHLG